MFVIKRRQNKEKEVRKWPLVIIIKLITFTTDSQEEQKRKAAYNVAKTSVIDSSTKKVIQNTR